MKSSMAVKSCTRLLMITSGQNVLHGQKQDKNNTQHFYFNSVLVWKDALYCSAILSGTDQKTIDLQILLQASELQMSREQCTHHSELEKQDLMMLLNILKSKNRRFLRGNNHSSP